MKKIDSSIKKESFLWQSVPCGDTGFLKQYDNMVFLALVDGLGRGEKAHSAAMKAEKYFKATFRKPLMDMISGLHLSLSETIGAVVWMARFFIETGELRYSGIGNITARVYGQTIHSLISRDGVCGYKTPSPRVNTTHMNIGDILILTSDGIKSHIYLKDYPDLLKGTAEHIAKNFIQEFKKKDDASCLVMRYLL